jgi:pre-rRNA-processing protein TSR1
VARVRAAAAAAAAETNAAFPDEVDTPTDAPARARFARYRGLKSFRTSAWDPKEQLPRTYARLFQFADLAATRKRVLAEAEAAAAGGGGTKRPDVDAEAGQRVIITLADVPVGIAARVVDVVAGGRTPVVASGMLRHENRRSVVHFGLQRVDDAQEGGPVKAKEPLEMHCGFARFVGRPMLSEHNANSDKHKMERYLVHGRYTVASFYGPAVYAPAPALLFRPGGALVATGSALGADPDRIVLKRIVLTGYPYKTQKKRTVVKFMFFNADDIRWFRPVELWTKLGRTGHIVAPIGTHGRMKCIFDSAVLHHDTVCLTLYKRVYPKSLEAGDDD